MDTKQIEKTLSLRVFSLALLIVLVNSWLAANTGREIKQFALINVILAILAVLGSIAKYLTEKEQESIKKRYRAALLFIFQTPVLVGLWSIFIIVSLFVSSVTLQTRTDASEIPAGLTVYASKSNLKDQELNEILKLNDPNPVLTNPFGKDFKLDVEGYQSQIIHVYPFKPKKVDIEKDLIILPTVLIRMSDFIVSNQNVLIIRISSHNEEIYRDTVGNTGAFLIGIEQEIPTEFFERWKIELMARNDLNESAIYECLKRWFVDILYVDTKLNPEDTLNIKFIHVSNGSLIKEINYIIGFDTIQDLLFK